MIVTAAHPRSRGEHFIGKTVSDIFGGSSPLARGTLPPPARQSPQVRLIPARAGNTAAILQRHTTPPAHPRSRGEHLLPRLVFAWVAGSSPLARGTRGKLR